MGDGADDADDGASPLPFLGALAIILLVVIGIGAVTLSNRGEDNEREAVVRAALAQNDALQRLDYGAFRANTCAQQAGTEATVLGGQRDSTAAKGARYVDNVTAVSVDGDRATATVAYYFADSKDAKIDIATTFVREDGAWKVCTAGPS
ncbi:MAG: lumazine-binding protein [Mycobacterium sp.]|nr:lumazine-binding protein [Mycobacterium sp.]